MGLRGSRIFSHEGTEITKGTERNEFEFFHVEVRRSQREEDGE